MAELEITKITMTVHCRTDELTTARESLEEWYWEHGIALGGLQFQSESVDTSTLTKEVRQFFEFDAGYYNGEP